jgi:hypothetical protein
VEFVAATNLGCHQAAFPAMLDFIVKSVHLFDVMNFAELLRLSR